VNLIGSTFSADYMLHLKLFTFAQGVSFIPAYNTPRDYSANETDSLAFPAYKNFSFSLSSIDTYLNDSPASLPPTKRNSFQFTMGLTYAIKSKY
jgi:heme-binding NEAT domain protein